MIFMDLDGIWEMSVKSLEATRAMFKLTILTFVAIFVTISSALASIYINCMDIIDGERQQYKPRIAQPDYGHLADLGGYRMPFKLEMKGVSIALARQ